MASGHAATRRFDLSGLTARASGAWSELGVSDPGLLRLRSACRATLSFVLTVACLVALLVLGASSVLAVAIGAVFAIMGSSLPRDPTPRARLVTVVGMALSGATSAALTASLARWPALGEAAFLLILFGAVLVQTLGPRAVAAGFVAVVVSYLTLFLHADLAHVPSGLVALPLAGAIVLGVNTILLPERPREALARIIRTVERRGALLLHDVASPDTDSGPEASLRRRRLFGHLNETILVAEEQLAVLDRGKAAELSHLLLQFELALIHVAVAAATVRPLARAERTRIRLTAMRLHASRWSPLRARATPTPLLTAIGEVEATALRLSQAELPVTAAPSPGPAGTAAAARPPLALRPAARAGIAALLSMACGYAISPDRWFWAVLTAYLLFLGARSSGDTIFKGVQRVWGSAIGLVVGVLVSTAVTGHPVLEGIGLVACVFGLTYVFALSQTIAIFCVTVMLGLVYSLLGTPAEAILILRLEETGIGAAAAILVGFFVFPRRSHDLVHDTGARLLASLAEVVRRCARQLDGDAQAGAVATMRDADRLFRDLRAAVRPLQAGHALVWWARAPTELPAILSCMFWVRVLATTASLPLEAGADRAPLVRRAEQVAAQLARLAGPEANSTPDAGPTVAGAPPGAAGPTGPTVAVGLSVGHLDKPQGAFLGTALDNLENSLIVLADRFSAEGWTGLVSRRPI